MARNSALRLVNTFNKGLITEATGLNFPENAVTDCIDVIFDETAKVKRRKGFTFEDNYTTYSTTLNTETAIKEYVWKNVAGRADVNYVCLQIGSTIHFYRCSSTSALSSKKASFTVSLDTYKVSGAPDVSTKEATFAAGYNYLFIAHPYCDPVYVKWNSTSSITTTRITVKVRDFEGVDDGLEIEERPATLTKLHEYNLHNQGWYLETVEIEGGNNSDNPIDYFKEDIQEEKYPSNADIWWLYKNGTGEFDPSDNTPSLGNTEAPKGHFILKAFYQDRSGVSGITGLTVTTASYYRPSVVAFFSGRVFYAGTNYGKYTNKIYFSQIIQKDEQIGRCYQSNDPTSENAADLLPSDGGEILIPDMGTVYKMVSIQSTLVVFASNGVWSVGGSEGTGGFKATDYSVRKISSVSALNSSSFADIEGYAVWWNLDGIWTIASNQIGSLEVQSLSDSTIKTFYQTIPNEAKRTAKAVYNERSKVVQWLYKSSTSGLKYKYDRALNFNTLAQCFYPLSLPTNHAILGVVSITGEGLEDVTASVVTNSGDNVINIALDDIVVLTEEGTELSAVFKYITGVNTSGSTYNITFSEASDNSYYDFDNVDYSSYLVTGYTVDGKGMLYFQSNYVSVFMEEEDDASCLVQGIFDWSNSSSSGKWGTSQQAYRVGQLHSDVRVSRLKVRGKGRSIQLKFTSESGKPFTLLGWAMAETANATP